MDVSLDEIIAALPEERRKRVDAKTAELIEEELQRRTAKESADGVSGERRF